MSLPFFSRLAESARSVRRASGIRPAGNSSVSSLPRLAPSAGAAPSRHSAPGGGLQRPPLVCGALAKGSGDPRGRRAGDAHVWLYGLHTDHEQVDDHRDFRDC
jgi:hypothetical protein